MALCIPKERLTFFDDVTHRFRQLLHKSIVSGIDPIRLSGWLANFVSAEDKYIAGHLINGLTYRSNAMVKSSFNHLVHCELPGALRACGALTMPDLDAFDEALSRGGEDSPIRFVAVDGTFEKTPGKSGSDMIRQFRRHLNVSKTLLCRPERLLTEPLPASVKALVFIDDLVGTGQQFETFATHYKLSEQAKSRTLVYCPLMAFHAGLDHLAKKLPWLKVHPVETLDESHRFFRVMKEDATVWGVDNVNKVQDVRDHVAELCRRNSIPPKTKHCLDLVVAFEHAVPNNSVPMLSLKSAQWQPLFDR